MADPYPRVKVCAVRAAGEILNIGRRQEWAALKTVMEDAGGKGDPAPIRMFLAEGKNREAMGWAMTRAFRPVYAGYRALMGEDPAGSDIDRAASLAYDHLGEILAFLSRQMDAMNRMDTAAGSLLASVEDPDPAVRGAAAYSLGRMRYRGAVEPLLDRLNDPHPAVRDAAVLALALFGDEILGPIEKRMASGDPAFRILALDVLSRIGLEK
jgi:hypothetical protein